MELVEIKKESEGFTVTRYYKYKNYQFKVVELIDSDYLWESRNYFVDYSIKNYAQRTYTDFLFSCEAFNITDALELISRFIKNRF